MDINIQGRPLTKNGEVMNDKQFIGACIDTITKYETDNKKPAPGITPTFKAWLNETKARLDNGENIVDIKNETVVRCVPDYSVVVEASERANK